MISLVVHYTRRECDFFGCTLHKESDFFGCTLHKERE